MWRGRSSLEGAPAVFPQVEKGVGSQLIPGVLMAHSLNSQILRKSYTQFYYLVFPCHLNYNFLTIYTRIPLGVLVRNADSLGMEPGDLHCSQNPRTLSGRGMFENHVV